MLKLDISKYPANFDTNCINLSQTHFDLAWFSVSVLMFTLGPTQPLVQWVPGVLSPGVKRGRGVMLTTHPI
jgi:hypothetical protein